MILVFVRNENCVQTLYIGSSIKYPWIDKNPCIRFFYKKARVSVLCNLHPSSITMWNLYKERGGTLAHAAPKTQATLVNYTARDYSVADGVDGAGAGGVAGVRGGRVRSRRAGSLGAGAATEPSGAGPES